MIYEPGSIYGEPTVCSALLCASTVMTHTNSLVPQKPVDCECWGALGSVPTLLLSGWASPSPLSICVSPCEKQVGQIRGP